jgi:hypothetical protein
MKTTNAVIDYNACLFKIFLIAGLLLLAVYILSACSRKSDVSRRVELQVQHGINKRLEAETQARKQAAIDREEERVEELVQEHLRQLDIEKRPTLTERLENITRQEDIERRHQELIEEQRKIQMQLLDQQDVQRDIFWELQQENDRRDWQEILKHER